MRELQEKQQDRKGELDEQKAMLVMIETDKRKQREL